MIGFSLITDKWLPVVYMDGSKGKISPLELCDERIENIDCTRADLQGAAWQFLIGLMQSTIAPEDDDEWLDVWDEGITETQLKEFEKVSPYFIFREQSPSFMQDFDDLEGNFIPLASLLPETPGENTVKLNKDFFIKDGSYKNFCPHCAALSLFSLQLNAPSGGQGHRTGLRGGGPLTTLIELHEVDGSSRIPLWRKLWVNVIPQDSSGLSIPEEFDEKVFPWLAKTRISKSASAVTTPEQCHPLQSYWGMPRRIKVDFNHCESGSCDICGQDSSELLNQMIVQNYGTNYVGWIHPLTPYRRNTKAQDVNNSVKPQRGGLVWKDWLGLSLTNSEKDRTEIPAAVIRTSVVSSVVNHVGVWAFGYDFDNMKVRGWYEHHLPMLLKQELVVPVRLVIEQAMLALSALKKSLSMINRQCNYLDSEFWSGTENQFVSLIKELEKSSEQKQAIDRFNASIKQFTLNYFDQKAFTLQMNPAEYKSSMDGRKFLVSLLYKKANSKKKEK